MTLGGSTKKPWRQEQLMWQTCVLMDCQQPPTFPSGTTFVFLAKHGHDLEPVMKRVLDEHDACCLAKHCDAK